MRYFGIEVRNDHERRIVWETLAGSTLAEDVGGDYVPRLVFEFEEETNAVPSKDGSQPD